MQQLTLIMLPKTSKLYQPSGEGGIRSLPAMPATPHCLIHTFLLWEPQQFKIASRGPQNGWRGPVNFRKISFSLRTFLLSLWEKVVTEKKRKVEEEVEKNSEHSGPLSSCQSTAWMATDWNGNRSCQYQVLAHEVRVFSDVIHHMQCSSSSNQLESLILQI